MTDLIALRAANAKRWQSAKLTRGPEFVPVAKRLFAAKQRYVTVQIKTGVPWYFIAVVHEREASQRWDTQLGQGDALNRTSTHVPRGRGPFNTWEEGAVDALMQCPPLAGRNKDWSIGGLLTECELYNGLGPEGHGVASGYVWSGTTIYTRGKYVSDGVWDPNVVDKQLGCAGMLLALMQLDQTITFTGVQIVPPAPTLPKPPVQVSPPAPPSISNPAKGSIGAFIASIFAAIFKRKV